MPAILVPAAIKLIEKAVDLLFDRARARFLGPQAVPKRLYLTLSDFNSALTLPGIYASSAREERAIPDMKLMDALVRNAGNYLDAYRSSAKARVVKQVSAFLQQAEHSGVPTDLETVLGGQLADLWKQTSTDVRRLVDTESTNARNMGTLEGIVGVNASQGVEDPIVYWVVVRDEHLCSECKKLHLLDDGVTPRLWKLSEVGHGYHKKGDSMPAVGGLHPHCLTGAMRIHTDRGLLTVRELFEQGGRLQAVVDSRVRPRRVGGNQYGAEIPGDPWLYRHGSGTQLRAATHVYETGVQPCLRITLDSGHELEVSNGHEMWVDDGKAGQKVRADALRVGDKIPLLSGAGAFGQDHFPELAELMGNLLGDGVLGNEFAAWNFFGDDIAYGRFLKELAAEFSPRLDAELIVHPPDEKYQVSRASFQSACLRQLFVEEFSLTKSPRRVPARIWSADEATVAAFLRGLYAADGHSEATPSVVLAQNDKPFLQEVQALLSNFGLRSRIFDHGELAEKSITYANGDTFNTVRQPCWRLAIGGWEQVALFAERIGLGVPAKQDRLQERLAATEDAPRLGAWRTARVFSIVPIGEQPTYCLTEPMTNTITVNGVVTGQCRCTMATLMQGYGFGPGGAVRFVSLDHDEFKRQRG